MADKSQVITLLRDRGDARTSPPQIREVIDVPERTLRNWLRDLVKEGVVESYCWIFGRLRWAAWGCRPCWHSGPSYRSFLSPTTSTYLQSSMNRQAQLEQVRGRYTTLTCREREVMALVVSGWMNKQVSDRLSISIITVKAHRERVMRKMAAGSLAQLVYVANELAITRVEPRAGTRFRVPENRMDTAHAPG